MDEDVYFILFNDSMKQIYDRITLNKNNLIALMFEKMQPFIDLTFIEEVKTLVRK